MQALSRPQTRVFTRRHVSTRRRVGRLVIRAHAATRWNTTANGALTKENIEKLYQPQGFAVVIAEYNEAYKTGLHKHLKDFIIVGLGGEYVVKIDGQTIAVKEGDVLETPPDIVHEEIVEDGVATKVAYAVKGTRADTVFVSAAE
eukprot:g3216.t1